MAQFNHVTAGTDTVNTDITLNASEVLSVFSQAGAVKNSDQFLLIMANQNGTVSATKVTAQVVRAYLNQGFEITVDQDGNLYIGGVEATALNDKIDGVETSLTGQIEQLSSDTVSAIAAERSARIAADAALEAMIPSGMDGVYYAS